MLCVCSVHMYEGTGTGAGEVPAKQKPRRPIPGGDAFIYGTSADALVYTYDATRQLVVIELAIVNGEILPHP